MVISVAIQKGGTGKTTTAATIAQAAAAEGKRVLAIDLDPQGNLTFATGADVPADEMQSSYGLFYGADIKKTIQQTEQGIYIIPARWDLSTIKKDTAVLAFENALTTLRKVFDLIVIDSPPNAGLLQYMALYAADRVIIPAQTAVFDISCLFQIVDTVKAIQRKKPDLSIMGIIVNKFDIRSNLKKQLYKNLCETAESLNIPILGTVRNGVAIEEAAALHLSLFDYAPESKPAQDFKAIYETITKEI